MFRSFYDFKLIFEKFPRGKNSSVTLAVLTSGGDSQGKNSIMKDVVQYTRYIIHLYLLIITLNRLTVIETLYS